MPVTGVEAVVAKIKTLYITKQLQAEELSRQFAVKALTEFRQHQFSSLHEPDGKAKADTANDKAAAQAYAASHSGGAPVMSMGMPWINRSFRAARTVFGEYESTNNKVGFSLYHTMSYGVYLELARNRKYAALEPIVRGMAEDYIKGIKAIYS
jgi:hypothetical protein